MAHAYVTFMLPCHVCVVLCLSGGVSGLYLHFVKHHCHQFLLIQQWSYTKNEVFPDVCQSWHEGILLLYTTKIYIQLIVPSLPWIGPLLFTYMYSTV